MKQHYRLLVSCPDQLGIVSKITGIIAERNGWLTEASYHADAESGWFYMRTEFYGTSSALGDSVEAALQAAELDHCLSWELIDTSKNKRMVILVSHESHCLSDLLHRWDNGELTCDIAAVISNHDTLRKMVGWYNIPFHHVPSDDKSRHFLEIDALLNEYKADTTVLARYMQILPEALCDKYAGKIINIHHSFLPSFIGANPYRQAFNRGVKLIGATCHYVTQDLDEGPIIEQDVARVTHKQTKDDLVLLGRDVERLVLARGIKRHLEDRVFVQGNKTIVLD